MQQMNQTLRRSLVLNRMAESISQKVGKPWYESCFNSVQTTERTLFLLYFRSRKELDEVDVDEWTKQQEAQASTMTKVSQLVTSATPYLGLRLRALEEFYASPRYSDLRNKVETGSGLDLGALFDAGGGLKKFAKQVKSPAPPPVPPPKPAAKKVKVVEGACPKCGRRFAFPLSALPDKPALDLQCKGRAVKFKVNLGPVRASWP